MADNIADLILGGDPGTHLLQEAFAFDITLTKVRCAACNTVSCLGSLAVDGGPLEALVKCADCGSDHVIHKFSFPANNRNNPRLLPAAFAIR